MAGSVRLRNQGEDLDTPNSASRLDHGSPCLEVARPVRAMIANHARLEWWAAMGRRSTPFLLCKPSGDQPVKLFVVEVIERAGKVSWQNMSRL